MGCSIPNWSRDKCNARCSEKCWGEIGYRTWKVENGHHFFVYSFGSYYNIFLYKCQAKLAHLFHDFCILLCRWFWLVCALTNFSLCIISNSFIQIHIIHLFKVFVCFCAHWNSFFVSSRSFFYNHVMRWALKAATI